VNDTATRVAGPIDVDAFFSDLDDDIPF